MKEEVYETSLKNALQGPTGAPFQEVEVIIDSAIEIDPTL